MARKKSTLFLNSFGAFLEVWLNLYLKKHPLPKEWSGNISRKYIDALFCCTVAWNPWLLSNASVTASCPSIPSNSEVVRFGELYAKSPEFTLNLMIWIRNRVAKMSQTDRVILFLRCGRHGHLVQTVKDGSTNRQKIMSDLNRMMSSSFFEFFALAQEMDPVEFIEPTDWEIAAAVGNGFNEQNVRDARRRMAKDDIVRIREHHERMSQCGSDFVDNPLGGVHELQAIMESMNTLRTRAKPSA